jgi:hypothetical protein
MIVTLQVLTSYFEGLLRPYSLLPLGFWNGLVNFRWENTLEAWTEHISMLARRDTCSACKIHQCPWTTPIFTVLLWKRSKVGTLKGPLLHSLFILLGASCSIYTEHDNLMTLCMVLSISKLSYFSLSSYPIFTPIYCIVFYFISFFRPITAHLALPQYACNLSLLKLTKNWSAFDQPPTQTLQWILKN